MGTGGSGDVPVVIDDSGPASWLADAVREFDGTVRALLPATFEAYARILHPAYRERPGEARSPVSWRAIAAAHGRSVHRLVQFPGLLGREDFENGPGRPDVWDETPEVGSLPAEFGLPLSGILAGRGRRRELFWFAVWQGFGDLVFPRDAPAAVHLPARDFLLFRGRPGDIETSCAAGRRQSANLWWPDDHSWCVSTDIDLVSTYVGGSRALVADVLAASWWEAFPARPDDPIGYRADTVNPSPRTS